MNTSFNKKGEPLINNMEDVINIFDSTKLDGIATNDLLILK
jgi:predicted NodU family carbamoyl transferase